MTTEQINDLALRKQLLWRATHRGIREMDIIVGGFVTQKIGVMTQTELVLLERLLDIPDQDYLAWLTHLQVVPTALRCDMLDEILNFRPEPAK
jgi:antitoxin CptB